MDTGGTYREICTVHTHYVVKKYGEAIVVFDGYGESSTKDMVHQRRAKGQAGVAVTYTEDMKLTMKKANFLANSTNKQQFINMLGNYLEKKCKVYHAPRRCRCAHCTESSGISHTNGHCTGW